MLNVLILTRVDNAGSSIFACQAINSIGRVNCRLLTFHSHPYEYPTDLLIPRFAVREPMKDIPPGLLEEVNRVIAEADLIHMWNDEPQNFDVLCEGLAPIPWEKVKSYTFSGTYYRERPGHAAINARIKPTGAKVVVQNPFYTYPDEIESEFIPHAINLDRFTPLPLEERSNLIGCYDPAHGNSSARQDVRVLEALVKEKFPGWDLGIRERSTWTERIKKLAKCSLYFEYMDSKIGYFGRSALEACALGIPTMSYISDKAVKYGIARLDTPSIIHVTHETMEYCLERLIGDKDFRKSMGEWSRRWIEEHFSYPVVGELYTKFFEGLA